MGLAKSIRVEPIRAPDAIRIIRTLHYSGKVVNNSRHHFGVFLDGRCGGAMSFGPPMDKRKLLGLVRGSGWESILELNRMALAEWLPRNSESRAIAAALRTLKRKLPRLGWVVSFADATQCGDGAIYRASGFTLTGIKRSVNLAQLPDGTTIHKMTLESNPTRVRDELRGRSYFDITGGRYDFRAYVRAVGGTILDGYQLRYVWFASETWRGRLAVQEIPYSKIAEMGARMVRGVRSDTSDTPGNQPGEGGATPTRTLATVTPGGGG